VRISGGIRLHVRYLNLLCFARCARSCFSCPQCSSSLAVQATETLPKDAASSSQLNSGPTYVLVCAGCKWSSNEVGWEFERPTGIARKWILPEIKATSWMLICADHNDLPVQLSKIDTQPESVQSEFDALKDHLGSYVSSSKPPTVPRSSRRPTRHISHLTQMAAKALHRDVPGMARLKGKVMMEKEKVEWDELGEYQAKGSWRSAGLEDGMEDVEMMGNMHTSGAGGFAGLERRWERSWDGDRGSK